MYDLSALAQILGSPEQQDRLTLAGMMRPTEEMPYQPATSADTSAQGPGRYMRALSLGLEHLMGRRRKPQAPGQSGWPSLYSLGNLYGNR